MVNCTLNDNIENIKKELDKVSLEYSMAIEDSHRLGMSVKDIHSEDDLKRMEATAYSTINKLKGIDEEYRFKAIVLYNSIASILNH